MERRTRVLIWNEVARVYPDGIRRALAVVWATYHAATPIEPSRSWR
jgi:hypothetical protein